MRSSNQWRVIVKHVLLALLLMSGGCSVVLSTEPVGEVVTIDPADWEGTWQSIGHDDALDIRVIDATTGELLLTPAEPKKCDGGEAVLEFRAFVRRYGDWTFLSLPWTDGCEDDTGAAFLWGAVEVDEDMLLFWLADTKKFEQLVEGGELAGDTDGGDVLLYPLEARGHALITSDQHGSLFHWRDPSIYRRIAPTPVTQP
jgi:hypothetical protein